MSTKTFKRLRAAVATSSLLIVAACGGGGGSKTIVDPPPPPPPPPAQTELSGMVAKGVMRLAQVLVFEVKSDGSLSSDPIARTTTNPSGRYIIPLPASYGGGPLKVKVVGATDATMICDAPSGCGDVPFGKPVPITEELSLSAVKASGAGKVLEMNITPLTDLASRRASKAGLSAQSISDANDVVRQTFGVSKDIVATPPIDVTDPQAVSEADRASQQTSVLSAAVLEAVQATDDVKSKAKTIEQGLDAFAQTFADDGGLVLNDTDASGGKIVSADDILSAAEQVVSAVEEAAAQANVDADLGAVQALVSAQRSALPAEQSDEPDTSRTPLDSAMMASIDKAKAFVSDLRDVAHSAQLREEALAFGDRIQLAFADQTGLAEGVLNEEASEVLGAAMESYLAMAEAAAAFAEDDTLTEITVRSASDDIVVHIAARAGERDQAAKFSVKQDVGDVAVDVSADADVSFADSGSTQSLDIALTVLGSATSSSYSVNISQGDVSVMGMFERTDIPIEGGIRINRVYTIDAAVAALEVRLAQTTGSNPLAFVGNVDLELTDVKTGTSDFIFANREIDVRGLEFGSVKGRLSGAFSDSQSHSLEAFVELESNNDDGIAFGELFFDSAHLLDQDGIQSNETADAFLRAKGSVGFSASLPGIDDTTEFVLHAERTGLRDAAVDGELHFAGKAVTFGGASDSSAVTLTNQDGLVLKLELDDEHVPFRGHLLASDATDAEELANLDRAGNGTIVIRYKDGSLESFQ